MDKDVIELGDLRGRRVVITGATSGVGLATAHLLAAHGAAVTIAARDPDRGAAAAAAVRAAATAGVEVVAVDLGDLAAVKRCAAELAGAQRSLDVLVNNAAVQVLSAQRTADGFEVNFGVNHLGHFALTALLLPALRRAERPRVVTVASEAHRRGELHLEELARGRPSAHAYEDSKLANLLFARELQRRADEAGLGLTSVACHPGFIDSQLARGVARQLGGEAGARLEAAIREHAAPPERGALPVAFAAIHPGLRGGEYVEPVAVDGEVAPAVVAPGPAALDQGLAVRLWALSERLTGLSPELAAA